MKTKKYFLYNKEPDNKIDGYEFYDINKITKIKNHTVSEFFIFDILDYFIINSYDNIINDIFNKLTDDGILYIQSYDIYSISASLLNNQIRPELFNALILSQNKKSINSLSNMVLFLKNKDFNILESKFINGIQYFIKAQKHAK